jgi:hypothetical protein
MKKGIGLAFIFLVLTVTHVKAQVQPALADSAAKPSWEFSAAANAYFLPDDFFVIPVLTADRNHLHLEARYNYEDFKTVSLWGGYAFWGGKNLEWNLIPMSGLVLGNTNGVAAGLEATLAYKRFEFYTEGEWLISFEDINENYIYFWSDLSYSPWDWLTIGYSGQRTRLYQTEKDIQKGFLAGVNYKKASLTSYFYNIGSPASFFVLLSAAIRF